MRQNETTWKTGKWNSPKQNSKKKKKKKFRREDSLRHLWNNIKRNSIYIINGEEREKGLRKLSEDMAEKFPNLEKEIEIQVQESEFQIR